MVGDISQQYLFPLLNHLSHDLFFSSQILYSKLFIVMGIPWIFECTHYFAHGDHANSECLSTTEFVLRAIGCINLLRGCLIFFIFVCKESTLDKVKTFLRF